MWICNMDIPPEIFELILSFAGDDQPTLRSCALTCRDWYAVIRPYLFRDVVLVSKKTLERLEEAIRSAPILGSLIQTLKIRERQPRDQKFGSYLTSWTPAIHYSLPNKVTRLHTIELENLFLVLADPTRARITVQHPPLLSFTSTTTLIIRRCTLEFEILVTHISALPELRILKLCSVYIRTGNEGLQRAISRCPLRLDSLHIHCAEEYLPLSRYILLNKWILGSALKKNLRLLRLTIHPMEIDVANQLLRGLVDNLVDLDLGFSSAALDFSDVDFSCSTGLRIFTIRPITLHALYTFPGSLTTSHIEQLRFHVPADNYGDTSALNLALIRLSEHLVHFTVLRQISFIIDQNSENVQFVEEFIKATFPEMNSQGSLLVTVV